jgi:hypothetical protein
MKNKEFYDKYINYFVIGLVSLVALFFLPFLGSEVGLQVVLPNTVAGWIVFAFTKIVVAVINVLIFHCFIEQGKLNVKDNERYQEAAHLLDLLNADKVTFISPDEFYRKEYGKKGITLAVTSILSAFGLAQAILTWDALTFLTYLFTILMGLIFGILEMAKVEGYLTTDFWYYAKHKTKIMKAAQELKEQREKELTDGN